MKKYAVVVDSTTPIPENLVGVGDIYSVPVRVYIDDQEFKDSEDLRSAILDAIRNDRKLETSLPAPNDAEELLSKLTDEYERVYVLTVSSKLSGTYSLFSTVANKYENVLVFDSKTISIQNTYILERMVLDLNAGKVIEEDDIISYRDDSLLLIPVFDLSRLEKSGRIGRIVSLVGRLIHIKPIITIARTGEVELVGKAISVKKVLELLRSKVEEFVVDSASKYRLYAAVGKEEFKEYAYAVGKLVGAKPTFFPVASAILSHVGEEAFGLLVAKEP